MCLSFMVSASTAYFEEVNSRVTSSWILVITTKSPPFTLIEIV